MAGLMGAMVASPTSAAYQPASEIVPGAAAVCGETCLKRVMDSYLTALGRHDPSSLPIASDVRSTENGVDVPLGEALWVTFTGLGKYRHDVYDPSTGGVASFLTITENDRPAYLMVRLKVVRGKLTQIETVVNRGARNAATQPDYEPMWDAIEPPASRLTREQLITATIGYMRAFALLDGKLAPFAESCIRMENGMVMSLGPNDKPPLKMPPLARDDDWFAAVRSTMGMGCTDQIDTKVYAFINEYDNARFPIVDVERQIVYSVFDFRRRGTVKTVTMPNGKTYPHMPGTQWPNEVLNTEAWKFRDGKITRIEAVFVADRPYKQGTGWEGMKGEKRTHDIGQP
jgi:hypothetical protein